MGVANGQYIALQHYTEAAINFNSAERWPVDLIVAPHLVYDIILGTPFMYQYKVLMAFNPTLRATLVHDKSHNEVTVEASSSLVICSPGVTCAALTSFESPAERELRRIAEDRCTFTSFEKGVRTIAENLIRETTRRFRDRFPDALPACRPVDRFDRNHQIDLLDGSPLPQLAHYPGFSPTKLTILRSKLQSLLDAGIIVRQDGRAPACSPGFLVTRGTKARLVGDYRILNAATRPHAQDIPSTQDIIDLLGRAQIFTLSDMMSGYFQLRIVDESQHLTTFSTPLGRFKYTVTAMGLRNAGSDFQKAVRACLQTSDLLGTACFNYLDDIIIFSNSPEEHAKHVEKVLEAMRADGWYLSYDKSQVGVFRIKILGHWVEKGRVYTDPTYVSKLTDVPSPNLATNKIKALQGFLGLVGYYRRFIPEFASIAAPLTRLLRKTTEWTWGEEEERARKTLAEILQKTVDKGLAIYDKDRPTRIQTDASGHGLGAVLEQLVDDTWTPIAYISKTLTPQEASLVNYERELFAIYVACKKWLCYLQDKPFTILCDCNALCNIRSMSLTNRKRRVVTMLLFLGTLSFTWQHVKGSDNAFADGLSRLNEPAEPIADPSETLLRTLPEETDTEGDSQPRLPMDYILDDDSDFLFSLWDAGTPSFDHLCSLVPSPEMRAGAGNEPRPQDPLTWKSKGWLRHSTLAEDLELNQLEAPPERIDECAALLDEAYLQRDMDVDDKTETVALCDATPIFEHWSPTAHSMGRPNLEDTDLDVIELLYSLSDAAPERDARPWDYSRDERYKDKWEATAKGPQGHYHRDPSNRFLMLRNQYIVPGAAVQLVLADIHKTYGHVASSTLIRMLTHWRLWWPDLRADCTKYVENCITCNLKSITSGKVFGLLGRRPSMDKAQEIAVDFAHLPPVDKFNGVLGVIDRASRFTFWIPASSTWSTRDCFIAIANNWCRLFGWPVIVRSDNGPNLSSEDWNNLWKIVGVQPSHSDPYHPQSNGIIERSFGTLKRRLRAIYHEDKNVNWMDMLPFIQGCHNSTTRESLGGSSPAEVMFGFCPRWDRMPRLENIPRHADWLVENDHRMAQLSKSVAEAMKEYEKDMSTYTNVSRIKWTPVAGDLVFVSRRAFNFPERDGLNLRYLGPVAIAQMSGQHSATIIWDGEPRNVAIEYLRPCRIDPNAPRIKSSLSALWAILRPERTSNLDDQGVWDAPIYMDALDDPDGATSSHNPPTLPAQEDTEEFAREGEIPTQLAVPKPIAKPKKQVRFANPIAVQHPYITEPPPPTLANDVDTEPLAALPKPSGKAKGKPKTPSAEESNTEPLAALPNPSGKAKEKPKAKAKGAAKGPTKTPAPDKEAHKSQQVPTAAPPKSDPAISTSQGSQPSQSSLLDPEATWSPTHNIHRHETVKGRTVFHTKWANKTKATKLFWSQLVHLDTNPTPPEWVANEHLLSYLSKALGQRPDTILERIDEGDLPGFLDEAEFNVAWLKQLIVYYQFFKNSRKQKLPLAEARAWESAIGLARESWRLSETEFPTPKPPRK